MSHTQTPWTYRVPVTENTTCAYVYKVGSDKPLFSVATKHFAEDAKRIVACVNACAGFTTAGLEQCIAEGDTILKRLEEWQLSALQAEDQIEDMQLDEITGQSPDIYSLAADMENWREANPNSALMDRFIRAAKNQETLIALQKKMIHELGQHLD